MPNSMASAQRGHTASSECPTLLSLKFAFGILDPLHFHIIFLFSL